MGKTPRRNGTYYARIFIPKDLQVAFNNRKDIWRSLFTKEPAEARLLLPAVLDEWPATSADMRRQRALSDGDIKAAVYVRYSSTLEAGDRERTSPTAEQIQHSLEAGLAKAQSHPAGSGIFDAINSATEAEVLANKVHWASERRR